MQDPRYRLDHVVPLYQLANEIPVLTKNRLRHMADQRRENGAEDAGAIFLLGRQRVAHRIRFSRWLLDYQGRKGDLSHFLRQEVPL